MPKPMELLHVDDSSLLRKSVARGLEPYQEFYNLTQTSSVDEALALMNAGQKFDLILTDWLMNGKSGFNFLCALKAHPAYHNLPVFFLTSEYESSSLVTVVTYGASGIIKKPATGPEIHAYLQKKIPMIEEARQSREDLFLAIAPSLLTELATYLPIKNQRDLAVCMQTVQNFRLKASTAKWPLLAEYAQKIEDAIQGTLQKETAILIPISGLLKEFSAFIQEAVGALVRGQAHPMLSEQIDINLKSYKANLEAGWFAHQAPAPTAEGILLPLSLLEELRSHVTPEGLALLERYLPAKKAA